MNQRTKTAPKPAVAPPAPAVQLIGGPQQQQQMIDAQNMQRQMRAQQTVSARKIAQLTEESMNKEVELEIIRNDIRAANERVDVINIRNIVLNNIVAALLEEGIITDEQFATAQQEAEKSMRHFNSDPNVLRIMESNLQFITTNIGTFRQEYATRLAAEKGGKGAAN